MNKCCIQRITTVIKNNITADRIKHLGSWLTIFNRSRNLKALSELTKNDDDLDHIQGGTNFFHFSVLFILEVKSMLISTPVLFIKPLFRTDIQYLSTQYERLLHVIVLITD